MPLICKLTNQRPTSSICFKIQSQVGPLATTPIAQISLELFKLASLKLFILPFLAFPAETLLKTLASNFPPLLLSAS